ncbi:MAG: aldehyde dehydrogenase family protein, partial [Pseudomonadota bacterium]
MPLDQDLGSRLTDATLLKTNGYIDGAWVAADSGETFAVDNPANGGEIAKVADQGAAETRRAIDAAYAAWKPWEARTAKERGAILRKWFELIMANQDDLAAIATAECGKPLAEAKGEVAYGASFIEWFAEDAKRVYGDTIPTHQADKRIVVLKQAIGVV